jgi:hypothetical protein
MQTDPQTASETAETEAEHETKSGFAKFEVVHASDRGRPLFLTARRFIRICRLIEKGASASTACKIESVTYAGFRKHVQRNEKYQRRLKEAEETREDFFREFHIANIAKHAQKNLLASLWWLERRFPNEFALRTVNRNINSGDAPIGDQVGVEQLRRYGKLMLQFAKESEQPVPQATE